MSESARRMLQYQERNAALLPIMEAAALAATIDDDPCDSSDDWLPVRIEFVPGCTVMLNRDWVFKVEEAPARENLFHYSV